MSVNNGNTNPNSITNNNNNNNMNTNVNNMVNMNMTEQSGARPRPQYSISDLYAMNPQFVQQFLAVRGISPNIISGQGGSLMGGGGGPQQQFFMPPNQAQMLAHQMNSNPGLMQMNSPLIPSQLPPQQHYTQQQHQNQLQYQLFQHQLEPQQLNQGMKMRHPYLQMQQGPSSGSPMTMAMNAGHLRQHQIRPNSMLMQQQIPGNYAVSGGPVRYRPNQSMRPHQQNISPGPGRPRPLDPSINPPSKIAVELHEHARVVRARIIESITSDHRVLSAPNLEPFKGKSDSLNRLLPYHIVQLPDYPPDSSDNTESKQKIDKEAKEVMERISSVLEENSKLINVPRYEVQIEKMLEAEESSKN